MPSRLNDLPCDASTQRFSSAASLQRPIGALDCRLRPEAAAAASCAGWRRIVLAGMSLTLSACATANTERQDRPLLAAQTALRAEREIESTAHELRSDKQPLLGGDTLSALEASERQYQAIVAAGGWPTLQIGKSFRPGDGDERTQVLAQRLAISMDLPVRTGNRVYAADVTAGLQRFQKRHGLRPTGIADAATVDALNVKAESRLAQLRANIVRMRDYSTALVAAKRYVLVNIPAFQLEAVEADQVAQRHRVIVGRQDRQTPGVKALVRTINFFPFWHVPDSVARSDLVPRVQQDPGFLKREHIRVLEDWQRAERSSDGIDWRSPAAAQLKFRQDPGPWNALGFVRLDMPNEHSVYMHDTPMKDLFAHQQRAFTAGCVRVEGVFDLVSWVLRDVPGWDRAAIDRALANGQSIDVALAKPVPVLFAYLTAWASPDGRIDFRSDIYGRDGAIDGHVAQYSANARTAGVHAQLVMSP
jgi:L,D-transpeptidase YcbB